MTEWLLIVVLGAPMAATVVTLFLVTMVPTMLRPAATVCTTGLLCSCASATFLAVILKDHGSVIWQFSPGLEFGPRRLPSEWGLQMDQLSAIWIAVTTGLAWLTVQQSSRQDSFAIFAAMIVSATIGFVLATGLLQMLFCWMAISLSTLTMTGWCSVSDSMVRRMRRAVVASLAGDALLLMAILAIGRVGHSTSFADLSSSEGMAQLGAGNPTFPGVVGCLVVLSMLPRCGLFPCFGWHHAANSSEEACSDQRSYLMIYGIAYVPSAVWVLVKFHTLLISSEVVLELLGGLGVLGAVLGAFVACGQKSVSQGLAYLLAAQSGLLMAALGSGHHEAIGCSCWHLCAVMIATYVLVTQSSAERPRLATWCAALSLAGAVPLAGGWSQQSVLEMNSHPIAWVPFQPEGEDQEDVPADATNPENRPAPLIGTLLPRRGSWICGLWAAQAMSAFAIARFLRAGGGSIQGRTPVAHIKTGSEIPERYARRASDLGALLLLLGGPIGWLLGYVPISHGQASLISLLIGQSIAIVGLLAGYRARHLDLANADGSLARLAHERMYIDQAWEYLVHGPTRLFQTAANRLTMETIERVWTRSVVRISAGLGMQSESLLLGHPAFYVCVVLLSTVMLLLTLLLAV